MLEEVPEPVWKTSIGNWSSCSPAATESPAVAIRSASAESSSPSSPLTSAAAALSRPSQRTTGTGTRSPETGKLSTALVVSPPQSCSVKVCASIEVVVVGAYSATGLAGVEAFAVDPQEGGGGRVILRAVAGGGGEAANQLGVDASGLGSTAFGGAQQVAELQIGDATRFGPRFRIELRRDPDQRRT